MTALLTPVALSEYLSVPTKTLANWRSTGKGPRFLHVGKHVRYRLADVEAWLTEDRPS